VAFKPGCVPWNKSADDAARFWSKVKITDGCWEWQAHRVSGYGQFSIAGRKLEYAHRVSWVLSGNAIPQGLSVLHRCDNPACVRPDHLFLGTQLDNMKDMIEKGRDRIVGSRNVLSKLTEAKVEWIRRNYAPYHKEFGRVAMAKTLGVTKWLITRVVNRQIWKHI